MFGLNHGRLLWMALAGAMIAILLWQELRFWRVLRAGRRARDAQREFLAGLGWRLQQPLDGLRQSAETLAVDQALGMPQQELAGAVLDAAETLRIRIEEALAVAEIADGRLALAEDVFDPREVVEEVAGRWRLRAAAKRLPLETVVMTGVAQRMRGDRRRLCLLLGKLLANAVRFTNSGNVHLEVAPAGGAPGLDAVVFQVRDTGAGMAAELVGSLFDGSPCGGTGLSKAGRLASLMGGSIDVESQLGVGSTFRLVLPAGIAGQTGEAVVVETREARPARVLIVDDNPINQLVTYRAVNEMGYDAAVVSGAEQALDALRRQAFDLILMDCQMPGTDGYQACAEIRRREAARLTPSRVPIVGLTATEADEDPDLCLYVGMDDYLAKPIPPQALARTIERWIGRSRDRPEAVRLNVVP